jgi:hypothetical protein
MVFWKERVEVDMNHESKQKSISGIVVETKRTSKNRQKQI